MKVKRHPRGSFFKPLLPSGKSETCEHVNRTVQCFQAGEEEQQVTMGQLLFICQCTRTLFGCAILCPKASNAVVAISCTHYEMNYSGKLSVVLIMR